jgi:hypothetical protein
MGEQIRDFLAATDSYVSVVVGVLPGSLVVHSVRSHCSLVCVARAEVMLIDQLC